jgi:hypothetical protein
MPRIFKNIELYIGIVIVFGVVLFILPLSKESPNIKSSVDTLMEYDYPDGYEYRLISSDGFTCKVTRKEFILAKGNIGNIGYYKYNCQDGWE